MIGSETLLQKFIGDFASVKGLKVLVHGGGKETTELANKMGVVQTMVKGRRITDAETLKIATMVYAGLVNKRIVSLMQANGVQAIGLSGADGNVIKAKKRVGTEIDYGFAGDVTEESVNTKAIASLLENGFVPVFCSITHDGAGQLLNTNADTIASVLAAALSKEYTVQLNYCFEKKGVMKNVEDESSVISKISKEAYKQLLGEGIISEGMIPKLDNSFDAISKGVNSVIIGHSDRIVEMTEGKAHQGTELVA